MSDETLIGPDTQIGTFISHTGTVHRSEVHSWGIGAACTNRFMQGMPSMGPASTVDCGRCS